MRLSIECERWLATARITPRALAGLQELPRLEQAAAEIKAGLRKLQLRQPLLVESAMGKHTLALHGRAAAGRRAGTAASGGVAGVRDARRIDTACINV